MKHDATLALWVALCAIALLGIFGCGPVENNPVQPACVGIQ